MAIKGLYKSTGVNFSASDLALEALIGSVFFLIKILINSWGEAQGPEVQWAFGPFFGYWSFVRANDPPPSQPAAGAGKAGPRACAGQGMISIKLSLLAGHFKEILGGFVNRPLRIIQEHFLGCIILKEIELPPVDEKNFGIDILQPSHGHGGGAEAAELGLIPGGI